MTHHKAEKQPEATSSLPTIGLLILTGILMETFIISYNIGTETSKILVMPAIMVSLTILIALASKRKTSYKKIFAILSVVGLIIFALLLFLVAYLEALARAFTV